MEIKFEVLLSSSIKRKKPWPNFCWLGKEKEGVFVLDHNRISKINLASGQTKKKIPKLQPLLPRVLTMSASQSGMWLAGVLVSGEVFLWHRDSDAIKMVPPVPAVCELVSTATSHSISLLVSGDGRRVLLATRTGQVFLWECLVPLDLKNISDSTINGHWSQIAASEHEQLPTAKDKEASLHCVFVQSRALGEVCLSAFVFTSGEQLVVTFLKIQWDSSSKGYSVRWATKSYPLSQLVPSCLPVKSRGALIPAFSPDGKLLAIILNQKDPKATQVLFISVHNFVTVSSGLGGCGSKNLAIPPKYIRSYWVGSVSWTPEGLYLACVLKRGSLLMLARLGGLVSLSTSGCDVEFGPAHFLPLHPLVTYRPPASSQPQNDFLTSSCASLQDQMRQRYSVTWHPRLPCLIVSDGYMATMLKMPRQPSSSSLMSCLLQETVQRLERVRKLLGSEQPQVRPRLESMNTLKFTASLLALKERENPESTLPFVFRDGGGTGGSKLTMGQAQAEGDDEEDSDGPWYGSSVLEDGGRLEFASMFDTLHARSLDPDPEHDSSSLLQELAGVRRSLLTAWALGLSFDDSMNQRERLLKFAVSCAVHLTHLLIIADSVIQPVRNERGARIANSFLFLKSLLSFLPWDSYHEGSTSCFALVVDFAQCLVQVFVPFSSGTVHSSQNFTAALVVLQELSGSLDQTYSLHQEQNNNSACLSDMFSVPVVQEDELTAADSSQLTPLYRPSNRLVAIWRGLYRQAVQYQKELRSHRGLGQSNELENMWDVISQIQASLQRAGAQLEQSPALCSITGEKHFIFGKYTECIQAWRDQLWAERETAGPRACFLETRYCLALLFGQLFQYQLKEAQAMCDYMTRQLQSTGSQDQKDDLEDRASSRDEARFDFWLPQRVNSEAAHAVVQSLGRFMASYFTNQSLAIFPPHNVDILPPLHMQQLPERRMVALSQTQISNAVRTEHLSGVWTVDYALELLLLGGLMPEAAWLAQSLGDWKMAVSLGVAYTTYCRLHYDFNRLKWKELHLPAELQPGSIFQAQLDSLLGCTVTNAHGQTFKRMQDNGEVEDMELLQVSVREILRASVMAEVDIVSQPLTQLLGSAKEHASSLPALVPPSFYLPAPPLYCPQPAPNTQDSVADMVTALEKESRCHVATALQRLLLLFRAAHCSRPAAQWYIDGLCHGRRLLSKVRNGQVEPKDDLSTMFNFTNRRGFFHLRLSGKQNVNTVVKQTMVCFRELCGFCWMLHVRDQLTISCRRFQAARNQSKDSKATDLIELYEEVLRWTCRLVPFSRFLNAEEMLQDLVLSLVSELPTIPMVAEALVTMFPDEEDSVRVPLREKYSKLLQRLNSCTVQTFVSTQAAQTSESGEEEDGESMMLLVQEQRRQRGREEKHLSRKLVPVERYIWEREEADERSGADVTINRLSLGTSLSNSILTDSDCLPVDSEGGATDTMSKPHSADMPNRPLYSPKPQIPHVKFKAEEKEDGEKKNVSMPVVGTWRFELEDEEYLCFLKLFLSYVLEKDSVDMEDLELPLLSSFSARLHNHELYSDTFDVMTTLKRRQASRKKGESLRVFRAGSCFHVLPETPEPLPSTGPAPSVLSEVRTIRSDVGAQPFSWKQPGLFGLRQLKASFHRAEAIDSSPVQKSLRELFKTILCPDLELELELDSKLEAQFPHLARLLEWMLRWADRSVLISRSSRKNTGWPAVIRAKSSAPAVLSALRLMEQRYSAALLGTEEHRAQTRVPEKELPVSSVLQTKSDSKRKQENSVDTGNPGLAWTPVILSDLDHHHVQSSEICEELNKEQEVSHMYEHEDMNSKLDTEGEESRRNDEQSQISELDGDSSVMMSLEESSNIPHISVQIKHRTPSPRDQALTLEDLKSPMTPDDCSESCSEELVTLHKTQSMEEDSSVHEPPEPASLQQPEQQQPSMSEAPSRFETARQTQSCSVQQNGENNPDLVRQLVKEELLRLVQQQLTIRSDLPQGSQADDPTSIPPSQGLLTTVKNHAPPQVPNGRPLVTPLEMPAPTQGIRLLRLPPPPPLREAWPPNHSDFYHYKPSVLGRSEDSTQHAKPVATLPYLNFNQHTIPEPSETRRVEKPVQLPSAPNWAVPIMEPMLLHVPPEPQACPIQLLRVPMHSAEGQTKTRTAGVPSFPKPQQLYTDQSRAAQGHRYSEPPRYTPRLIPPEKLRAWDVEQSASGNFPRPQLLRIEPEPPRANFRYKEAPLPALRLIPLEELMAWAGKKTKMTLQLLKADSIIQSKPTTTPSKMRLKRKEDKKKQRGKQVSFRPNDSIIPPSQPEFTDLSLNDDYVIPLGSFDSMLTGQRLLAEAYATTAELHAFAATQKHPPDVHDACTNTDSASPRSSTDKAGSVQHSASPDTAPTYGRLVNGAPVLSPNVNLNRHSPDPLVPEKPKSSDHIEPAKKMGESPVSVNDLKDGTHLQDQLFTQDLSCPSPTSAQLHLLAASVINPAISNADVQTEEQIDEPTDSGPPELVYFKAEKRGDPVTMKVLTAFRTSDKPHRLENQTQFALSQASADLVDMDARLAVLNNIADHMDTEFANMRLLVNTTDTPTPLVFARGEDKPHSSMLSHIKEVKRYKHHVELKSMDDEEEEEDDDDEHADIFTSTPRDLVSSGQRGHRPVTASIQSSAHLQATTTDYLTDSLMEGSIMLAESPLGLTGLSDVADILGELVKEGALSPSAFHLTTTSSSGKPGKAQRSARTEEERKELRAWMKKKKQERRGKYCKQREEKSEKEHLPFTSKLQKLTAKDLELYNKKKVEKDKVTLKKHHSQRLHAACNLMTDMLTTPLYLPTASICTTQPHHQDSRPGSRAQSTGKTKTNQRGRFRSVSTLGRTVVLQRKWTSVPPATLNSRFGLHRPASALPGDRLSQVTRRGMLTDLRGRTRVKTLVQRSKPGINKSTARTLKEQEGTWVEDEEEERDVVSPWDVPLEIRQILGLEDGVEGQGLMELDDDAVSESTGSMLSKLDWAAIEKMAEEAKF